MTSAPPHLSRSSRVRGWTTSARDSGRRAGSRSTMRQATPRAASSPASVRPVGPPPTTRTSVSTDGDLLHLDRRLGPVARGGRRGLDLLDDVLAVDDLAEDRMLGRPRREPVE